MHTGGFYTEKLLNRTGHRVLVLNTNLYYDQNKVTQGVEDPAGQFSWADKVLTEAAKNKEKVAQLIFFYCKLMTQFVTQFLTLHLLVKHLQITASSLVHQVYIIGHVPPGFFEKKRSKPWFTPKFNAQYLRLIQNHHSVIVGQFFGHHHTDSFRMIYSSKGNSMGCCHYLSLIAT